MSKANDDTRPVRGMRDLLGQDSAGFDTVVDTLRKVAQSHGYSHIETPILEFSSLFARSLGEDTDVVGKEMFSFIDRAGQSVSLRPEGTASVVRAIISNGLTQKLPQKLYYWGPMFRYDRPQKGRYRQFFQFGVENLGEGAPLSDVDIVSLAYNGLTRLGIKSKLFINSIGDQASRSAYKAKLVEYFSKYEKDLSEDSRRRLTTNPLRILDSKEANDIRLVATAPSISDFLTVEAAAFFERVLNGLGTLSIDFSIDRTLVRGLDYYDHTTFEFKADIDGQSLAIVGGGRYNGLVEQMGGPHVPAVGLAFGIDRIMLAYDASKLLAPPLIAVLFVAKGDEPMALELAQRLRKKFNVVFPVEGNLGKRMKQCNAAGASCALILGEDEIAKNFVTCKFLKDGPGYTSGLERAVSGDTLEEFLTQTCFSGPNT
ncbi:MAG: histidine--tRNA ligase [Holosporales bacterium]|jgi:histidyl-tRNA synthetase|nr:histidine--tRNA ligase [Holosporales bacterium]